MNRMVRLLSGVLLILFMAACSAAPEPEQIVMNTPQETAYANFDEVLLERVTPYLERERWDYTDVPIDRPFSDACPDPYDLEELGYAYVDLNGDGQDEFLMGSVEGGEGQIAQAFSLVDGKVYELWNGDDAHRYALCADGTVRCRWGKEMRTNAYGRLSEDGLTLVLEEAFFYDADREGAPAWFSSEATLDFPDRRFSRKEMKPYRVLTSDEYDAGMRVRNFRICAMTTLRQWCGDRDLAVIDDSTFCDPWHGTPEEGILLPYTSYAEMLDTWKTAEQEHWPIYSALGYPYGYSFSYEEHYQAWYATLDINGDGVEELILQGSTPPESGDENGLRALYTMRDGHVLQLYLNWGERAWWQLCEDGVLKSTGVGGASSGGCSLWRLAEDSGREFLGEVSYCDGEYFDGDWYPPETAVKISKWKYNAFCDQYRVLRETELPEYTRLLPPQSMTMEGQA